MINRLGFMRTSPELYKTHTPTKKEELIGHAVHGVAPPP